MAGVEGGYVSVLDRLLDERDEPERPYPADRLRNLRNSIRRDMEMLLNMRARCVSTPAHLTEVRESLINFGIPDFSGANLAAEAQREHFRATVEEAVRRYEPRFTSVRVELLTNADGLDRTLRFRIEAYVKTAEDGEPVVIFDSIMEPVTSSVAVTSGHGNG